MDAPDEPRINRSHLEATVEASPPGDPSTGDDHCPAVALVEGSRPNLSREMQSVLHSRLRAAALILFVGFGLFLLRRWLIDRTAITSNSLLLGFHIVLVILLGVASIPLCRRCVIPRWWLRLGELLIFGLPAAFFALLQHVGVSVFAAEDQPVLLVGIVKSCILYWYAVIVVYGMFIPNTWRRTAAVVTPLSAVPVVLMFIERQQYPLLAQVITPLELSEMVFMMLIADFVAIFGTHTIHRLRREAFQARQLGQYRLKALIGTGGMGEVYLAEHQLLKRPCAIKVIRAEKAGDPGALARFEREVRTTARLTHWNTIEIYDYGRTDDGVFYYVMEYLRGFSLAEMVERFGPLPPERVVHFLRQTCQALREAHSVGLIHRDIKPGNIFAAQQGGVYDVAKLLDFGLVKPTTHAALVQMTQDGSIAGSPLYMAPEQAMGQELDARSDIYSLGATAYYLLTGRPPFEGDNSLQVLVAHARDEVTPPSQIRSDVPADLEDVVMRCLEKNPGDRFADVHSLERALEQCQSAGRWTEAEAAQWWNQVGNEARAEFHEPLCTAVEPS